MLDKKTLRQQAKIRRDIMPEDIRHAKSKIICKKLIADDVFQNANVIFCFISFGSEVETKR
ncbi:MAG: hypothetical protein J6W76_02510, partial [Spirochaetales bacterium]|nr:hypothetical protein [Spirochaetales bacterium]